jgi:hypothetical protein
VADAADAENTIAQWRKSVSLPTEEEPRPRSQVSAPPAVQWPIGRWIRLPRIVLPPPEDVAVVMERRRSVRRIDPARLREIANMVGWVVARSGASVHENIPRWKSLAASAGGLQVVEPILVPPIGTRAFRFDGSSARLAVLKLADPAMMETFRERVRGMAPRTAGCHIIVFAADMPRARACYEWADSLVLRDAGALLQTIHTAAEAFRMSALPLGILGQEACAAILPAGGGIEAVGAMIVGRPHAE